MTAPTRTALVGQAFWTRADKVLGADKPGYGFTAISPALTSSERWVVNDLPAITPFMGQGTRITDEQRTAYRPYGRAVVAGRAIVYRKAHVGSDELNRAGVYRAVFLIGSGATTPSLLDLFTLDKSVWWALDAKADFPGVAADCPTDLDLATARRREVLDEPFGRPGELPSVLRRVIVDGWADTSSLNETDLAALYLALPVALRSGLQLSATWRGAATSRLELLPGNAPEVDEELVPTLPEIPEPLLELAAKLEGSSNLEEARTRLAPPRQPASAATTSAGDEPDVCAFPDLVKRWSAGRDEIRGRDAEMLAIRADEVAAILVEDGLRLPDDTRLDKASVAVVTHLQHIDHWPQVVRILPRSARARASLATAAPVDSVMIAICAGNVDRADIAVPEVAKAAHTWPDAVLHVARADDNVRQGLVATLRASYVREQSWFRALAARPDTDTELWFGHILPAAIGSSDEAITSAMGLAPRQYIEWSQVTAPYDRALRRLLEADRNGRLISHLTGFLRMWRNNDHRS